MVTCVAVKVPTARLYDAVFWPIICLIWENQFVDFFGLESITFGHDFMELFVTLLITLQFP